MKFADEYFDEIKPGTILINIDHTDDEFTKGAEYEVRQDEEGLFLVDDCGYEELVNKVLAQYFVIKESEPCAVLLKELEKLREIKNLLIEKKRISDEWQNKGNEMSPSEEFIVAVYKIKDLDKQIAQVLADLEKEEAEIPPSGKGEITFEKY